MLGFGCLHLVLFRSFLIRDSSLSGGYDQFLRHRMTPICGLMQSGLLFCDGSPT